jgi:hypothetical protein
MTKGDQKQFAEDYKKSESYRIIQELKQKHKTSEIDIPYPEGCKLCNVATGCDGSCY